MNANFASSLQITKNPPKWRRKLMPNLVLNQDWLTNPDAWDKEKFSNDIVTFIEHTQGVNAYPSMVLIGMLAHQIDVYVQCTRQMAQTGLAEVYNKGATSGPSLYVSMADKSLNRVLQLMKELGLTPSHRIGTVRSASPEALAMEEFLAGP